METVPMASKAATPTASSLATAAAPNMTPNRAGMTAPGQGRVPRSVRAAASPVASVRTAEAAAAAAPPPRGTSRASARAGMTSVTGRVMETVAQSQTPPPSRDDSGDITKVFLLAGLSAVCVIAGWLRQARLTHVSHADP
jgi:hypothetical protein